MFYILYAQMMIIYCPFVLESQFLFHHLLEYILLNDKQQTMITEFERRYMFVIDVYAVYKYTASNKKLVKMFELDSIENPRDIVEKMQSVIME